MRLTQRREGVFCDDAAEIGFPQNGVGRELRGLISKKNLERTPKICCRAPHFRSRSCRTTETQREPFPSLGWTRFESFVVWGLWALFGGLCFTKKTPQHRNPVHYPSVIKTESIEVIEPISAMLHALTLRVHALWKAGIIGMPSTPALHWLRAAL